MYRIYVWGERFSKWKKLMPKEEYAMLLSAIFAPVSKNGPAKVKDPGLVNIVKAGYGLYDNHKDALVLLPLGTSLLESLTEEIEIDLVLRKAQNVLTGMGEEGGLAIASRSLKTEDQLPLIFMEREGNTLYASGFFKEDTDFRQHLEGFIAGISAVLDLQDLEFQIIPEHRYIEGSWEPLLSLCVSGDKSAWKGKTGFLCPECGWGGTECSEAAPFESDSGEEEETPESLEEAHTPGADTIEELCRQLELPPQKTLKTMFFTTEGEEQPRVVVALMRGDRKISPLKLARYLGVSSVRLATSEELHGAMGILGGYLGPKGLPENIMMVADLSVPGLLNVAIGANKPDYHYRGACWDRDFSTPHVTDLLQPGAGVPCPVCGTPLEETCWREIAVIGERKDLRARYSSVDYRDAEHKKRDPRFVSITISLDQLLLAFFEEEGSLVPMLAPFMAYLYVAEDAGDTEEAGAFMQEVYMALQEMEIPVLMDDCTAKPGNRKYNAEVLRFPWKLSVTAEGLAQGKILLSGAEEEDLLLSPQDLGEYFDSFVMNEMEDPFEE